MSTAHSASPTTRRFDGGDIAATIEDWPSAVSPSRSTSATWPSRASGHGIDSDAEPTNPPALHANVDQILRLRLTYLRRHAPPSQPPRRRLDPAEVVRVLLGEEAGGRNMPPGPSGAAPREVPAGKTFD